MGRVARYRFLHFSSEEKLKMVNRCSVKFASALHSSEITWSHRTAAWGRWFGSFASLLLLSAAYSARRHLQTRLSPNKSSWWARPAGRSGCFSPKAAVFCSLLLLLPRCRGSCFPG